MSSQVSAAETTAASTKKASRKGTDIPVDTPVLLLTNLGTPKTPATEDVRRYLREFLSDQHIIEMPRFVWKPILEGIILRARPAQLAEKYRSVQLEEDSPLLHHTAQQTKLPTDRLGIRVIPAMRCDGPALGDVLDELMVAGHHRIGVLSAYPQYSTIAVASAGDAVCAWMQRSCNHPQIRFSRSFPSDPYYIEALVSAIGDSWSQNGRPDFEGGDRVLLSYHSIPVSMHKTEDPYRSKRLATTEAVRERLDLSAQGCVTTLQFVFGPFGWLKPTTIDAVEDLTKAGTGRVDIIYPGFVPDCLEALEEIDQPDQEAFLEAGGPEFHCVPQGNDVDRAIDALEVQVHVLLSGWTEQGVYEDGTAR